MSGGSMDYVYYHIQEAANRVQSELAQYELLKNRKVRRNGPYKHYAEAHPDVPYLQDESGEMLRDEVIKNLREGLAIMRKAAIYAERIEWLTSSDDSEESFCIRLDEQLAECERTGGVQ